MSATLPTNFNPNHAPTAGEMGQVLSAIKRMTNVGGFTSLDVGLSLNTTSTSYIDVTNWAFSFTKDGDANGSNLLVTLKVGWRTGTAPTNAAWAVNINGVDIEITHAEITTNNNAHYVDMGQRVLTNIPAGTFTIQVRVKRLGGSGTVVVDSSDVCTLVVQELPK